MSDTAQQRRADAARRAKEVPPEEHVPVRAFDHNDWTSCIRCGAMEPRGGYRTACKGWVKVTTR